MITEAQRRHHELAKPAYAALMKFYPLTLDDLDGEIWRPIAGYENYQVSNYGRVKSFYNGKVKILKPAIKHVYLQVTLCKDCMHKLFSVHRLVALAFIPNPEGKPQINHRDGRKLNNYVENLEWVTGAENSQHAFATGLRAQGEESARAKFTNEQVKYIRQNPDKLTTTKLAEKFGVCRRTISDIQRGKKYKTVGGSIREKQKGGLPRVPDNLRNQIRAEYKKGSSEYGSYALAKKYGVSSTTILQIVKD